MVKEQIIVRGIATERVLAAMRKVPREEFVPERFRAAKLYGSTIANRTRPNHLAATYRRVHDRTTAAST